MAGRYDVFLCHNQADKPAVQELADRLRAEGLEPWLDTSDLRRGVPWTEEVEKCLVEQSASCAVIIGPNGLGPWQEQELRVAQNRQVEAKRKNGSFPVIPVLLPGGKLETLPPFLKGHTCVFFPKSLDDKDAFDEFVRAIRGLPPLRPQPASAECPYRGLEFFDVAHASYFYGREELTTRLLDKLRPDRQNKTASCFLAIVGASGSGKSSLARAGLVAALKRRQIEGSDKWPIVICRPGSDPISNLAVDLARAVGPEPAKQTAFVGPCKDRMPQDRAALHENVRIILPPNDPNRRLVILVDQFEELFTTCRDEKLRQAFIDNLLYASQVPEGQTLVLLAMRADFYGKCASYKNLADALSERQQLIGPMTREELQEAIEKPAQKVGCELEPGLVELLLNDVANDPGSLPFLQFALKELWTRRTGGRRLTTKAYRGIGGVTGALQRKADEVYAHLSEPQKRICRRIFLRLTQPGEGTEDTKRRVPISELKPEGGSLAEVQAVLLDLSEAETRLITGEAEDGEEFFEVAHEALIRGWPELRKWIDADRAALLTQRRLTEAANEWDKKNRSAGFLYGGARLATAREWAAAHPDEINSLESEFLRASRRHALRQRLQIAATLATIILVITFGWLRIRAQNFEQNNRMRAEALVDQLKNAEISRVPAIVAELNARDGFYRHWADPLLREEDAHAAAGRSQKLRLDLALLQVDSAKVPTLRDDMLLVTPAEFPIVCDALYPYAKTVVEPLWNAALDDTRKPQERFQAACALATYAPADARWKVISFFVGGHLVTLEASALVAWRTALHPVKTQLIDLLVRRFRDQNEQELIRRNAAEILATYVADRPEKLFDLLADSEQFQFPLFFDQLAEYRETEIALAHKELERQMPETATEDDKERLAKRQANVAIALLRLGLPDKVWALLKFTPDPRVRSYVIHRFTPFGCDPRQIIQRLDIESDSTIRCALMLTLGESVERQLNPGQRRPNHGEFTNALLLSLQRQRLIKNLGAVRIEKLLAMYENEPDARLHGATEWLLRKCGQENRIEGLLEKLKIDEKQLQARKSNEKRQWYVNTQKQTFVIVDARDGSFSMGSPVSEGGRHKDESRHLCRIGRRFALAAKEVTKAQFGQCQRECSDIAQLDTSDWSKTNDAPQVMMTWYEAAAYCNWLSQKEGIPIDQWCYEPNKEGKYAAGMKAKDKFWELVGYRLPTEAEWEFACRAGTVTSRYYGLAEQELPNYAWYAENGQNHVWSTGSLQPNDWGLFDMMGNAIEWCFDGYVEYSTPAATILNDTPETASVREGGRRLLRGAAFDDPPQNVRSAYRYFNAPDNRDGSIGFRPVRTYP
jgi:formylglycine-generating enzyme required for sulfatase activity